VIRINLLPREERVRKRTMPTIKLPAMGAAVPFVVLGLVAGGVFVLAANLNREVHRLETEVAALRQEAQSYKPQLEKIRQITQQRQEVSNRLDIIARLDQERYFRVKLMDEMSRCVPDNLWVTKLEETAGRQFALEGVTFSNFIVARFMTELEDAPHFQNVELNIAQEGMIDKFDVVQFSLMTGAQP